ncbi:hypothetical protein [Polaribacter sargassicola]|nr:hypothetical protein [Polaribacter sp. DS7-9]MCG1036490.1 hypothetical protein [Polaribacter sp. DS7-9]
MSNKTEKNDLWDDLTDAQKNEIHQEVNELSKKKKTTWEDVKNELSKLK